VPEQHILELGQVIYNVHDRGQCFGQWCCIHHPMPGPWSTWPRYWREDRGFMERICPCGIGHPVAEDYAGAVARGQLEDLVHGCCYIHPCTPIDGGIE
jgi:hypothetical protein